MNLCDTGPLVAIGNRNDPDHAGCLAAAATLPKGPLLTTWPCFTEAMYLVSRMGGYPEQVKLWRLRDAGRLILHDPAPAEVDRMAELMDKYRDLPMDLADASVIAAAERLGLGRVFTLDRHFHAYRLADGSALTVVP
ncbi:MAG TPA: PIN domain-containing protein [Isosphaeraceae bacterium]